MLLGTPQGLTPEGHRALALLTGVLVLWITQAVSLSTSAAIIVVGLLASQGHIGTNALRAGYASPIVFFLVGVIAIGIAVEESGLANRFACYLVRLSESRARRLYWQLIAMLPFAALILPSAVTRNAVLLPVYRTVFSRLGHEQTGSTLSTAVSLSLAVLNHMASTLFLTGGAVPVMVASFVGGTTWLTWFSWMALPYIFMLLVGGVLIQWQTKLRSHDRRAALNEEETVPNIEAWTSAERRTCVIVFGALLLWLADAWHGLHPSVPAWAALAALVIARVGLKLRSFTRRLPWRTVASVGAILSMVTALERTGAVSWCAKQIVSVVMMVSLPDSMMYALIALAAILVHAAIPSLIGSLAVTIPLSMEIAGNLGLSPVVSALVVTIANDSVIFYPAQSVTSLMVYQEGCISPGSLRSLGFVMAVILLIAVPFLFIPYWRYVAWS